MSYANTESAKQVQQEAEREAHNCWMDERGYVWCPVCFEQTGLKRLVGWSPRWVWDPAVGLATEATSGVLGTTTCPVCRWTQTRTAQETVVDDPVDGWEDRVAP